MVACSHVSRCEACEPKEVTHLGEIHGVPRTEAFLKFLQLFFFVSIFVSQVKIGDCSSSSEDLWEEKLHQTVLVGLLSSGWPVSSWQNEVPPRPLGADTGKGSSRSGHAWPSLGPSHVVSVYYCSLGGPSLFCFSRLSSCGSQIFLVCSSNSPRFVGNLIQMLAPWWEQSLGPSVCDSVPLSSVRSFSVPIRQEINSHPEL